jgi:polysaccharide biosynthesis/export protein
MRLSNNSRTTRNGQAPSRGAAKSAELPFRCKPRPAACALTRALLAAALLWPLAGQELKTNPLAELRELEPAADEPYRLGAGDEIQIDAPGRPELTGKHVLGPDGRITLAVTGPLLLAGLTREEAAALIARAESRLYTDLEVTVRVDKYSSNRILLLGRVAQPGVLYFDRPPTLLEVLTRSGLQPAQDGSSDPLPNRCAIFRGKDRVFWIEVRRLLDEATPMADIRLRANDIVYVPGDQEEYVSVLGEVSHPGAVRLRRDITLADVIARAGGLTESASSKTIRVISASNGTARDVAFSDIVSPGHAFEWTLHKGDIVYVPPRQLAKVGYVLRQFGPAGSFLMFGTLFGSSSH